MMAARFGARRLVRAGVVLFVAGVGVAVSTVTFEEGELGTRIAAAGKGADSKAMSQAILNRLSYESKLPGMECQGDEPDWGPVKKASNLRVVQVSTANLPSCSSKVANDFDITDLTDPAVWGGQGWKPHMEYAMVDGSCWISRGGERIRVCGAGEKTFLFDCAACGWDGSMTGNEDDWNIRLRPNGAAGELPWPLQPGDDCLTTNANYGPGLSAEVEVDGDSGLWHSLGDYLPPDDTKNVCVYGVHSTDWCHENTNKPEIHPMDAWWWRPGLTKNAIADLQKKEGPLTAREKESLQVYTGTTYFGAAIDNSERFDGWMLNGNDGTRTYGATAEVVVGTAERKTVEIVPTKSFRANSKLKSVAMQNVLMRDVLVQINKTASLLVRSVPKVGSTGERYLFSMSDPVPVCANGTNSVRFKVGFEFGIRKKNSGWSASYCVDHGNPANDCIFDDSGVLTGRVTERTLDIKQPRFVGGVHVQTFNGRFTEASAEKKLETPAGKGSPKEITTDSFSAWIGAYYRDRNNQSGNNWSKLRRLRVKIPAWVDAKGNTTEVVFDQATLDTLSTSDPQKQFSVWKPLWVNQKPSGALYVDSGPPANGNNPLAGAMRVSKWLGPIPGGAEAPMANTKCASWAAHNLRVDFEINPNVANWVSYPNGLISSFETDTWEDVFKKSDAIERNVEILFDETYPPAIQKLSMNMPSHIASDGKKLRWRYEIKPSSKSHLQNFFSSTPDETNTDSLKYKWKISELNSTNKTKSLFVLYPGEVEDADASTSPSVVPDALASLYGDLAYKVALRATNKSNGVFRVAERKLGTLGMWADAFAAPTDPKYLGPWDESAMPMSGFVQSGLATWADLKQFWVTLRPGRHIRLTALPSYGTKKADGALEGGEEDLPLANGINQVLSSFRDSVDKGSPGLGLGLAATFQTTDPFAINWTYEVYELPTKKKVDIVITKACEEATAKKANKAIFCKSKTYFQGDTLSVFFPKDGYYRINATYTASDPTGLSNSSKTLYADSFEMGPPFADPSGSNGENGSGSGKPMGWLSGLSADLLESILKNPCFVNPVKCAANDPIAKLDKTAIQRIQMLGQGQQRFQGSKGSTGHRAPTLQEKVLLIQAWILTEKDLVGAGAKIPAAFKSRKPSSNGKP